MTPRSSIRQRDVERIEGVADLEALRALARATEIDLAELTANVNALLTERERCTIGDVLERYPASQGVASVVGLLGLAAHQGSVPHLDTPRASERVRWMGTDAVERSAEIPIHEFIGRVS